MIDHSDRCHTDELQLAKQVQYAPIESRHIAIATPAGTGESLSAVLSADLSGDVAAQVSLGQSEKVVSLRKHGQQHHC